MFSLCLSACFFFFVAMHSFSSSTPLPIISSPQMGVGARGVQVSQQKLTPLHCSVSPRCWLCPGNLRVARCVLGVSQGSSFFPETGGDEWSLLNKPGAGRRDTAASRECVWVLLSELHSWREP